MGNTGSGPNADITIGRLLPRFAVDPRSSNPRSAGIESLTLPAIFIGSFFLALTGAIMPGPLLTYQIAEAARRGPVAGPLVVAGHAILEIALVTGLALGALSFFTNSGFIRALGFIGGGAIIVIAVLMIRDRHQAAAEGARIASGETGIPANGLSRSPVLGGIVMSAANPYWSLWWVGIISAYLPQVAPKGFTGYAVFLTGHLLADLAWYSLVAAAVAGGRRWLSVRAYERLILGSAIVLTLIGAWFIADAVG